VALLRRIAMRKIQRLADSPPQQCPTCHSAKVTKAALTDLAVYLRCSDCGEVWAFQDRRVAPRPSDGKKF
jgi:transcription elongation factor Elf1